MRRRSTRDFVELINRLRAYALTCSMSSKIFTSVKFVILIRQARRDLTWLHEEFVETHKREGSDRSVCNRVCCMTYKLRDGSEGHMSFLYIFFSARDLHDL